VSENDFLEALADDPNAPRYELLPDAARAAYRDLLDARDAIRAEGGNPASVARLEARVQSAALRGRSRRRVAPWLWGAVAAGLGCFWFFGGGGGSGDDHYLAPPEDEQPKPLIKQTLKPPVDLPKPTATAVKQVLRDLGDRWTKLKELPKRSVVVVRGEFDQIERVLGLYGVPAETVSRAKLLKYSLANTRVLLIACGRNPTVLQRPLLVKRVKKFIENGGFVVATDWALSPYLTEALKPRITEVTPKRRQGDVIVAVQGTSTISPLLDGVLRHGKVRWWLEEAGKFAQIGGVPGKKARGGVLVRSDDLEEKFGSWPLVIWVPFGKGQALFSMAHFDQKRAKDAVSIAAAHRLLLNTILEAIK